MIKDILLATASYPEATSHAAVDKAVDVASRLGAMLTAIAFEVEIPSATGLASGAFIDIGGMIEAERRKSALAAGSVLATFGAAARARGVAAEALSRRCLTGDAPRLLTAESKLHDLTIVPVTTVDGVEQWYAESVIFGSGRPILILPEAVPGPALAKVAVAWDSSRSAARALADALPLLALAREVDVVTVLNEKRLDEPGSAQGIVRNLGRHGVTARSREVDAAGRAIGDVLRDLVSDEGHDLVVMGAYGHSRLRDFILGGATKSLLAESPVPLFMSH
jgi:nucleotide-binding universal stress UspA family protein